MIKMRIAKNPTWRRIMTWERLFFNFQYLSELYNMLVCFLQRSILMIMHKVSLEISNSEISHNLKGWSLSTFERIGVFLFQVRARVFCRTGWVRQISGKFVFKWEASAAQGMKKWKWMFQSKHCALKIVVEDELSSFSPRILEEVKRCKDAGW